VPISAILFGGRRATNVPLVTQSRDWQHGVFLGSIVSSEKTAAAAGKIGEVRFDPFAMLPFCGYNIGDYIAHWYDIGHSSSADKLPKLFWVNWFRKGADGKFLWPGYGDNSRVLKWVLERVAGGGKATDTPIGFVPTLDAIDTTGLDVDEATMRAVLEVDSDAWSEEVPLIEKHFAFIGARLPHELRDQLAELEKRLSS
jgi:phosphoenolpyruvate carboxykinase (GTP)